ncbi:MAG: hypothetical protein ACFB10_21420 [Salibacteraceae bacterium]
MPLEPCFDYYEINTSDVWYFEQQAFFNTPTEEGHVRGVLGSLQKVLRNKVRPIRYQSDFTTEESQRYFNRKRQQYLDSWPDIEQAMRMDFFVEQGKLYDYNQPVILQPDWVDFDWWFAMKLRQYHLKQVAIPDFLSFQLDRSFTGNQQNFKRFLVLLLRQYQPQFFSETLTLTIQDWITELDNQVEQSQRQLTTKMSERATEPKPESSIPKLENSAIIPEGKSAPKQEETTPVISNEDATQNIINPVEKSSQPALELSTEPTSITQEKKIKSGLTKGEAKRYYAFASYLLKAYDKDRFYFRDNMDRMLDVLIALKKEPHPFIDPKTPMENFFAIFQRKKIWKRKRVKWMGTNKELQVFVHYLNNESKKIEALKHDIWITTLKCFVNKDGKDYSENQLKNASGKQQDRYQTLKDILSKL